MQSKSGSRNAASVGMRKGTRILLKTLIVLSMLSVVIFPASAYLRRVSCEMAVSDATDLVTLAINEAIAREMALGEWDYDYFVCLEKDAQGNVTAIKSNMARINELSARLLQDVVSSAGGGNLDLRLPIGNLFGSNLLHGRGPEIPVRIIMLTSSVADFKNDISTAGINQIRHQIILEIRVDIDVLIPWKTVSSQVVSEVLVAETVIVGSVPKIYLNG